MRHYQPGADRGADAKNVYRPLFCNQLGLLRSSDPRNDHAAICAAEPIARVSQRARASSFVPHEMRRFFPPKSGLQEHTRVKPASRSGVSLGAAAHCEVPVLQVHRGLVHDAVLHAVTDRVARHEHRLPQSAGGAVPAVACASEFREAAWDRPVCIGTSSGDPKRKTRRICLLTLAHSVSRCRRFQVSG
jgi:hypothetical protein